MKKLFLFLLLFTTYSYSQLNPIFFGASERLLRFTQEFANPYWKTTASGVGNSPAIASNVINAPDGTLTADRFYTTANLVCSIYENEIYIKSGQRYTMSFYAKAGASGFFQIYGRGGTFTSLVIYANFDLINGIVTAKGAGTLAVMQLDNNGWYRCAISAVATARGIGGMAIGVVKNSTSPRQDTSTLGNECYIWGAKIERGGTATNYKNEFTQVTYTGASPITPI